VQVEVRVFLVPILQGLASLLASLVGGDLTERTVQITFRVV
jgi:hypothetical protein